jgi:hypothetical protein
MPLCQGPLGGRVDDVQERQVDGALNLPGGNVNGVASQQEEVSAGQAQLLALGGQDLALGGQDLAHAVPATLAMASLDLIEIRLGKHQAGTMQPAVTKPLRHHLVDQAVVDD